MLKTRSADDIRRSLRSAKESVEQALAADSRDGLAEARVILAALQEGMQAIAASSFECFEMSLTDEEEMRALTGGVQALVVQLLVGLEHWLERPAARARYFEECRVLN